MRGRNPFDERSSVMVAIIDYGVGNLFSLCSSLSAVGADVNLTGDPDVIRAADRIVLPGVGAF